MLHITTSSRPQEVCSPDLHKDVERACRRSFPCYAWRRGKDSMQGSQTEGAWLTLTEAAALLGVSAETVRRRVQQGQLEGEQIASPRGRAWLVWLPGAQGMTPPRDGTSAIEEVGETVEGHASLESLQLVPRLRRQIRNL